MLRRSRSVAGLVLATALAAGAATAPPAPELRITLTSPQRATAGTLRRLQGERATGVALALDGTAAASARRAAERVRRASLDLYYWVEVGRCPELADAHPEWMASLQGHPEWRRRFPKLRALAAGEVVKNYPWVPVRYREAFGAHLERVRRLLGGLPAPRGIFLNDLQAAPSACGCGNDFCRWTPDYGPSRTATELPPEAAANFVAEVRKLSPGAEVIPVWTTECEEHEKETACAGVSCFTGACWSDYTEQLMPVARESPLLGVLTPYRAFGRTGGRYGSEAGWVRSALASFAVMPPKRKGEAIPAARLLAVLQGWDVTSGQRKAQIARAREAGARGFVLAEIPIEQGWTPRIFSVAGLTGRPGR